MLLLFEVSVNPLLTLFNGFGEVGYSKERRETLRCPPRNKL